MKNSTPILDTLREYLSKQPLRLHVPFHTGIANNVIFPNGLYELDISEVSGYDVDGDENPLYKSEKITAQFFNTKHSFYLTGGASVGLLAALIALNKHGKKVIISRNSHKSVINGLVLAGLEPVWLDVEFLNEWGIFSRVNLNSLKKLLNSTNDLAGCVIVSPTYEGVISDVKEISNLCHKKNIPLIVDEAHGAHLFFLLARYNVPIRCADVVIQSWHKSLGSLTQSGVLHLCNNHFFNYHDIKRSLDLVSSTSPSFLLLLSLELTRKYLVETKGEFFNSLYQNSMMFKSELGKLNNIRLFQNDDPFKIYIKHKTLLGTDFAYELYKNHSVEVESANEIGLLMQVGNNFDEMVKDKVIKALNQISCRDAINRASTNRAFTRDTTACDPRKAFFDGFKNKQNLEYECDVNAPCPPGYAITIPGNKK